MGEEIHSKISNPNPNPIPNYHLLISTSTFIFPIIYSFKKNNTVLFGISIATLLGSMNYWRKPVLGYRRNIDLLTSNTSGIMYTCYGFTIIPVYPKIFGLFNLYSILFLYNKSCKCYHLKDNNWIHYHMLFHLVTTYSQLFVLYWL